MAMASLEELEHSAMSGDREAELAYAAALDEAGRHVDAVSALSDAAMKGNLRAKTAVALRILVGDRAPALPDGGLKLLGEAAREGDAQGAAALSVLKGIGAYTPQSWPIALDLLQLSAERGWQPARDQLVLLSPDTALKASARGSPGSADKSIWRHLRESIDIAAWTTATPHHAVSTSPLIATIEDFVGVDICKWLIERSRSRLKRAEVYATTGVKAATTEERTNSWAGFNLTEADIVSCLVQARMAAAVGVPLSHMEAFTILHYKVGEEFVDHYDFVDPQVPTAREDIAKHGQRIVTFLLYLSDDYEGGETAFPRLDLEVKGKAGDGAFFHNTLENGEPDLRTLHAGRTPTRGEKWVVSQFVRSRPIVPGAPALR